MVRLLLGNLSIMGPKARDCPDICDDLRFFCPVLTPDKNPASTSLMKAYLFDSSCRNDAL